MATVQEISDQIINLAKEIQNSATNQSNEHQSLQMQINNQSAKIQELTTERDELQSKYIAAKNKIDNIESQLSNTVSSLEQLSKEKDKKVDTLKLLDVYLVLMEQVFETKPHVRLLLMLHGDKEEYSLSELTSGSGIAPLQVKQAMFDLRNTGVVDYNEDTDMVKLKMRFLD